VDNVNEEVGKEDGLEMAVVGLTVVENEKETLEIALLEIGCNKRGAAGVRQLPCTTTRKPKNLQTLII